MRFARSWIAFAFTGMFLWALSSPPAPALARADKAGKANKPPASKPAPARNKHGKRSARELAARIDAVLAARWAKAHVQPAPRAEDAEFLRRVYLDLVGKIPTAAEARDFLDDPRSDRRSALVDRLLDSPAHTAHAAQTWRRLLLPEAETEGLNAQAAEGFDAWVRRKVLEDASYERIVREVLTAPLDEIANGANVNLTPLPTPLGPSPAAYYLAKQRKPENLAAGVARTFLGIRLECAQCHNHPFADWKREQFWGLAAFFAELDAPDPNAAPRPARGGNARGGPPAPRRELMVPGTKKVVAAVHLDGTKPDWRPRLGSRQALADWITAPDNPYFARAVANRVWARFFGMGLIEPIDELDGNADPELGGLLDELAQEFRAHGYDLKYLVRAITAARAYNLASGAAPGSSDAMAPMFAVMPVRGLSPAQLFDSLVQATGGDGSPAARAAFMERFPTTDHRPLQPETTIAQALTLMNGAYIEGATSPKTSPVVGAIAAAPFLDAPARIEALYLSALSRRPRPDEQALLARFVERGKTPDKRADALADVFWALLNGPEFSVNH